jgi:molybdopterin synthase catalytic subunit
MATKKMEMIEREATERWEIQEMAMVHRVGIVPPGEASVVIAVSSAHRDEAFKACRYLIDRLKEVVPIWKMEYFADGTVEWSQHTHEQGTAGKIGQ